MTNVRMDSVSEMLLRAMAMASYPNEACGILLGTSDHDAWTVVDVLYGRNRREDRREDRYDLHPDDTLHAENEARSQNLQVVGFWHSHPDHPAQPSAFDSERSWADYVYIICQTTANGSGDLNAFCRDDDSSELQPVVLNELVQA